MRTREQIVERARLHVGHREVTANRSPLIDAWLRRCGVDVGLPWCAAFASWCVEDMQVMHKLDGAQDVAVAQAGAQKLGKMFAATASPQPGDLMWFPLDAGAGHVGIVVAVRDGEVLCVEGNSANRVRFVRRTRADVRFSRTRFAAWPAGASGASDAEWDAAPSVRVEQAGTR